MGDKNFGKEQAKPTLEEALRDLAAKHAQEWKDHFAALEREATDPRFRAFRSEDISDRQANERSALMDRYVAQAGHEAEEGLRLIPNRETYNIPLEYKLITNLDIDKSKYLNEYPKKGVKLPSEPKTDGRVDTLRLKGLGIDDLEM